LALASLQSIAELLHPHRNLWQPQPFALLDLAWQQSHPHWAAWIEALPDPMLEGDPRAWPPPRRRVRV
jgi:hypothetical protein